MPTRHNTLLAFAAISLAFHGALALAPWNAINRAAEPIEDSFDLLVVTFAERMASPATEPAPVPTARNEAVTRNIPKPLHTVTDTPAGINRDRTNPDEQSTDTVAFEQSHTAENDLQSPAETAAVITEATMESSMPATSSQIPAATLVDDDAEATRNRLQVFLLDALDEHFHYPRLAQRHGWQGEVTLALRVEADGQLSHVRVEHSSGYAILDQAAAATLEKIARLEQAAAWLHGRHFDMVLPVRYQLVDG